MITLKQELERAEERIERIEYRSAERANEIEEALESYVTRVTARFLSYYRAKGSLGTRLPLVFPKLHALGYRILGETVIWG